VESQLKRDVYPDSPLGHELLDHVIDIEQRAVRRAALVTTCSAEDAVALGELVGVDAAGLAVVPNGTALPAEPMPSAERRAALSQRWRHRYWTAGSMGAEPEHLAVFFGSWHPPNLDAAELIIELAAELPEVLFVSAGRHGDAFANRLVPRNVVFAGMVSQRAKRRLLEAADLALNPMRIGSGTNLKLLEYLAAGVPVVSTPFGARGIDVVDDEHVRFAEPEALATVVAEVLADPAGAHRRALAGRELVAERYTWRHLGEQLAGLVSDIVPAQAAK
jgi:glycosyltransferase involved in cell wall biosynthesis